MLDDFISDKVFTDHVDALKPKLQALLAMNPVSPGHLPSDMPRAGVYLLSEKGRHLYVGRSNNIRRRIGLHSRQGATDKTAAFAFRLAREKTGNTRAAYRVQGSRAKLMEIPAFVSAFEDAKARIRRMELRFVEENDPVRQGLLEIYVAVVLRTPYNDFDTH